MLISCMCSSTGTCDMYNNVCICRYHMYVWRMGAYVLYGLATRVFFVVVVVLLAAWSRDCALRVRICDEAVFSFFLSFRGDVIYLSIWTEEEWVVGCACVCRR